MSITDFDQSNNTQHSHSSAPDMLTALWGDDATVGTFWSARTKRSFWFDAQNVPTYAGDAPNAYFGVHPLTQIPPTNSKGEQADNAWKRSQIAYIESIGHFYGEFDDKDYGGDAWPHVSDLDHTVGAPSIIVASGGGYHCYWLLDTPFRLTSGDAITHAKSIQRRWVAEIGSDDGAKDLARILRLPGTLNTKYDPPRQVELLRFNPDTRYKIEHIESLLPAEPERPERSGRPMLDATEANEQIAHALSFIPPYGTDEAPLGYSEWFTIIAAIKHTCGDDGLPLAEQWNGEAGEVASKWATIGDHDTAVGIGSIIHIAKRYGFTPLPTKPSVDVAAIIAAGRDWIMSADFAWLVPIDKQAKNGYRTNETDKAVASAILDTFERYGRLSGPIGGAQLGLAAGRGYATAVRALERLEGWFVEKTERNHAYEAHRYEMNSALIDQLRTWTTSTHEVKSEEPKKTLSMYATPFHTAKNHDAFTRSLRNITEDELADRNAARLAAGEKPMLNNSTLRRRLAASLPSAGPGVLLMIDALVRMGGQATMPELMEATHKKKWSVSRYVGRAVDLELVEWDGQIVTLRDNWQEWTDTIVEFMPTAGTLPNRTISHADATLRHCEALLRGADDSKRKALHRRRGRAIKAKMEIMTEELPGVPSSAVAQMASTPSARVDWRMIRQGIVSPPSAGWRNRVTDAKDTIGQQWNLTTDELHILADLDQYRAEAWA